MNKNEFVSFLAPIAVNLRLKGYILFPSTRIAQNMLETGSKIPTTNNLGGYKVGSGATNEFWKGLSTLQKTWEEYDGIRYDNVMASFRVYDSIEDFYGDQNRLLLGSSRYKRVIDAKDPFIQADMLQACGYATDSKYSEKIKKIIKDYGLTKYDEGFNSMKTVITKERIRLLTSGNLVKVPIGTQTERDTAYKYPGTDVRSFKLDKSKVKLDFVVEKGGKVSTLVKKQGADLGFNFPFFDPPSRMPIGYVWNDGKYINGASGVMKEWYELGIKGGSATIGKFSNSQRELFEFSVQGKILIDDGKMLWKNDGQQCQRTFVWIDAAGDLTIAIADGRTDFDDGLTCEEMALYAKSKGAVYAIEGDGGGSTILVDQSGGLNQKLNIGVNERAVHHAVLVYHTNAAQDAPISATDYKDSDPITYGDLKKLRLIK
jgi:hypothetical protein